MNFNQTWENAKVRSKRILGLSRKSKDNRKYEHKIYGRGSFYFEGNVYHTDDGSLITELSCVDVEMIRMGSMMEKLGL